MIDKTQPPPGWDSHWDGTIGREPTYHLRAGARTLVHAHEVYAEQSRPAVVEFAERVAAWAFDKGDNQMTLANREYDSLPSDGRNECAWTKDQIIAAARGERSLP